MLHEFLTSNRDELIRRCKQREAKRAQPNHLGAATDRGVPLFMQQLVETLRFEQMGQAKNFGRSEPTPAPTYIGRAAAVHGAEMLRLGYSIDQVVHGYGDVCQSVTEMAIEQKFGIAAEEFRTLNRCLDDAIADAVTAFGSEPGTASGVHANVLQDRLDSISEEQQRLIDTAMHAFSAVRTGSIGLSGATGTVLMHTLLELRDLAKNLATIRIPGSSAILATEISEPI
jgi:hypothetical protein